jgi:LysR family hydrogen peroxide-inducible transcriptional activator
MNLRDLKYAVAIADEAHFGRAAEACFVSQPALSGQIRKLEEYLGVALFERTKRSVRITPAGEAIVAQARDLLALAARIEETARAHADPLSGPLKLGMISTIGPSLTPILLPSAVRLLPQVEFQLSEDMTAALEAQLINGVLDAAITATPAADARLAEIPLYDEPFWIALPEGHLASQEEEVDLAALESDELLLLADGHCLRDQVISFCTTAFESAPTARTLQTSLTTILALVAVGAGSTLVPAMTLDGSKMTESGIALRREKSGSARRSVRLVFRRSFPRRQLVEKLADIIGAILPDTVEPNRL